MFHTLAFYTNDLAINASLVALGTVTDQIIPVQNNRYQTVEDWTAFAAYVGIPDCTAARINAPSLRRISLPYISPMSLTALPANVPPLIMYGDFGPRLERTEELTIEASRGNVAAADAYALLWVRARQKMATPGPIITVQLTTSITIAEGVWTAGNITLTQTLPAGRYEIVGMDAFGTNLLAARVIFPGGGYRPGVLAQGAQGEWNQMDSRFGRMGAFGTFDSFAQPLVECFGVGAGTSQIIYWDLVKVS